MPKSYYGTFLPELTPDHALTYSVKMDPVAYTLSNTLTGLCAVAGKSVQANRLALKSVPMPSRGKNGTTDVNLKQVLDLMNDLKTVTPGEQSQIVMDELMRGQSYTLNTKQEYSAAYTSLISPFIMIPDYGQWLREAIAEHCSPVQSSVVNPSLMRVRPHISLASRFTSASVFDCFTVTSPWHPAAMCQTKALMLVDLPRWSIQLFPSRETTEVYMEGLAPSDRLIGEARWKSVVVQTFMDLLLLYAVQPIVLEARFHMLFNKYCDELLKSQINKSAELLRRAEEYQQAIAVLASLPAHEYVDFVTNGLDSVSVISAYGQKRALVSAGMPSGTPLIPFFAESIGPKNDGFDLCDAYKSVLELGARQMAKLTDSNWNPSVSKTLDTKLAWAKASEQDVWDPRELVNILHTSGALGRLADVARRLGWGSAPRLEYGSIDVYGANFCMTDGDMRTQPIGYTLAGLGPTIHMGNRMAYGFLPQMFGQWNTDIALYGSHGQINWATCTAVPHIDGNNSLIMETQAIPAVGWMGESHAKPSYVSRPTDALQVPDAGMAAILAYWSGTTGDKTRSTTDGSYMRDAYEKAKLAVQARVMLDERVSKGTEYAHFFVRDWEPEVWNTKDDLVLTTWVRLITPEMEDKQSMSFMFSNMGFKLRFPCKLMQGDEFEKGKNDDGTAVVQKLNCVWHINPQGSVVSVLRQMGRLWIDGGSMNDMQLSHGTDAFDSLTQSLLAAFTISGRGGVMSPELGRIPVSAIPSSAFLGMVK